MRLIDADALREKHCEGCSDDVRESCKTDPVCASLMWVVEEPTIDAVEVVRCKDCKWYSSGLCNLYIGFTPSMKPKDFCSCGKRRKKP